MDFPGARALRGFGRDRGTASVIAVAGRRREARADTGAERAYRSARIGTRNAARVDCRISPDGAARK